MSLERVYDRFYRIPRAGAAELSDGGGPFGFDIHAAIAFDFLVERYDCDAIIETGCNHGDTTHFLAECYPHLAILTCDVVGRYVDFVRERMGRYPGVTVDLCDSADLVKAVQGQFRRPIYFLDAHWYEEWPLARELESIQRGVVVVDDFDIGNPRYGYDEYKGVRCGPDMLRKHAERIPVFYVNNPGAPFEYPCLQTGRLGGRAYFQVDLGIDYLRGSRYFTPRRNAAAAPAPG
jgi:hypothetical protein